MSRVDRTSVRLPVGVVSDCGKDRVNRPKRRHQSKYQVSYHPIAALMTELKVNTKHHKQVHHQCIDSFIPSLAGISGNKENGADFIEPWHQADDDVAMHCSYCIHQRIVRALSTARVGLWTTTSTTSAPATSTTVKSQKSYRSNSIKGIKRRGA